MTWVNATAGAGARLGCMYTRLLVPTDGSALADCGAEAALRLAKVLRAELVALCVVPRYPVGGFEAGVALDAAALAHSEAQWAERGRAMAERVASRAVAAGLRARAVVVHSDQVAASILAAAHKHGCDLVVMASHGRRGLGRLLLGSQTQAVLTDSKLPVLVVRAPQADLAGAAPVQDRR